MQPPLEGGGRQSPRLIPLKVLRSTCKANREPRAILQNFVPCQEFAAVLPQEDFVGCLMRLLIGFADKDEGSDNLQMAIQNPAFILGC